MNQEYAIKARMTSLEPPQQWPSRANAPEKKEESMAYAHQAHTPAASSDSLYVVVNLNRCQAYAQCCFFAPSVFKLHGEEALWYDPVPDPAQCEQVLRAAAACPVQAISIQWSEAAARKIVEEPQDEP